jgi:hypothetical protein
MLNGKRTHKSDMQAESRRRVSLDFPCLLLPMCYLAGRYRSTAIGLKTDPMSQGR